MKVVKGQIYENTHDVMRRSLTIHDIISEWAVVVYWVREDSELVLRSFTKRRSVNLNNINIGIWWVMYHEQTVNTKQDHQT